MEDRDRVVKHLEMIQGVVNRLGHDSFMLKGWSMTILAAGAIFIARNQVEPGWFILVFLIPVCGFWVLDGYFLWQERLFIKIYNDIRKQDNTDFEMNPMKHTNEPKCSWKSAIFSLTLCIFYTIEIVFVVAIFVSAIIL